MSAVLTPIKLERYCATVDDTREHLKKPFRVGDWVYATNGHICIRVPSADFEADVLDESQRINQTAPALFDKWLTEATYSPLPELAALESCYSCSGKGWHWAYRCEGCTDGEFVHRGHTYACQECENEPCFMAGWITRYREADRQPTDVKRECAMCGGRGFAEGSVELNGIPFELGYVHWAARLPGALFKTAGKEDPAAFRWDGGEALLMPLRF